MPDTLDEIINLEIYRENERGYQVTLKGEQLAILKNSWEKKSQTILDLQGCSFPSIVSRSIIPFTRTKFW